MGARAFGAGTPGAASIVFFQSRWGPGEAGSRPEARFKSEALVSNIEYLSTKVYATINKRASPKAGIHWPPRFARSVCCPLRATILETNWPRVTTPRRPGIDLQFLQIGPAMLASGCAVIPGSKWTPEQALDAPTSPEVLCTIGSGWSLFPGFCVLRPSKG